MNSVEETVTEKIEFGLYNSLGEEIDDYITKPVIFFEVENIISLEITDDISKMQSAYKNDMRF